MTRPARVEPCDDAAGHQWEPAPHGVHDCELCQDVHAGWWCPVCWETVDSVWHDDPREVPPEIVARS